MTTFPGAEPVHVVFAKSPLCTTSGKKKKVEQHGHRVEEDVEQAAKGFFWEKAKNEETEGCGFRLFAQ